jgi:hypothetical protein
MVCPNCKIVGALTELDPATVGDLQEALARKARCDPRWHVTAHWCGACDTPIFTAWPMAMDKGARRELVGLPADLVEVDPS